MSLGKLDSLERRLGAKDETEIADEIEALRDELRAFRREHTSFRERSHAAVDATIAEAGQFAQQLLDEIATTQGPVSVTLSPGSWEPAPRAACLLALTQPAFAKAWHAAVDRAHGFSELTVAEFEKRQRASRKCCNEHSLLTLASGHSLHGTPGHRRVTHSFAPCFRTGGFLKRR